MRTLAAVTASIALVACASPGRPVPRGDPFQYRGYFATYPTGLRLVALQTAEVGRATVRISYGVGSTDDPVGKEGLARLAVTLTDRSAPGRGGFTLSERYFASGARDESRVSADEVVFHARARLAQLGEALAVEADRMRAPLVGVTEEEFRSARETLARTLELAEDGDVTERAEVVRRAFAGTRYGRPGATAASVRAIRLEDVRRWVSESLVPARAVLVVTGAEVPEEVGRQVLATFGPLAATGVPGEPRTPPVSHGPGAPAPLATVAADETLPRPKVAPHLWLSWLLPGDAEGRTASAAATAALLEGRLLDRARELNGPVTRVDVTLEQRLEASAVIVRVDLTDAAAAPRVRDALVAAAASDQILPTRGGEVWRRLVRDRVVGEGFWRMEDGSVAADAGWMVRALGLSSGDPLAALRTQAEAQIDQPLVAYYRAHVRPERARRVVVMDAPLVNEHPGAPVRAAGWVSRASVLEAASPGPDRVLALVEPPRVGAGVRHRLSNGLEVRIFPRGTLPVVDARLLIDTDLPEGPMASVIPLLSLRLSQKRWTLSGDFACSGSAVVTRSEKIGFVERGPVARLDHMLGRLACWTQREVSTERVDRALETARRGLRLERYPGYRSVAALLLAAYGDPRRTLPTEDGLAAASSGEAKRWLDAQLRPDRAVLVLIGNVSATPELLRMLEEHFGGWRARGPSVPRPSAVSAWPSARRTVVEDFPGSDVAVIGIALRVPAAAGERDDAALRTLRHLVDLRVYEQVIELEGGSSVAVLAGFPEPRLDLWVTVKTAHAAEALKRTLATLERIAHAPPRDAEAGMARWMTAREEAFRFDTVQGAGDAVQEAYFRREPLEHWDALPASLAGVDPARIHAAARSTSIGREAIAVMGDASALEPALKAAGLTPEVLHAPPKAR